MSLLRRLWRASGASSRCWQSVTLPRLLRACPKRPTRLLWPELLSSLLRLVWRLSLELLRSPLRPWASYCLPSRPSLELLWRSLPQFCPSRPVLRPSLELPRNLARPWPRHPPWRPLLQLLRSQHRLLPYSLRWRPLMSPTRSLLRPHSTLLPSRHPQRLWRSLLRLRPQRLPCTDPAPPKASRCRCAHPLRGAARLQWLSPARRSSARRQLLAR